MLFVQGLVVLSEHKALRLYHLILILQGLIVMLEGFGLSVIGLFRQHQKLPQTWNSLASARQAKLALVELGDTCFNTLFLLYSIPSMNGTCKAHIAGNQSVVVREKEARRHQRLSRDGSLLVGFAF